MENRNGNHSQEILEYDYIIANNCKMQERNKKECAKAHSRVERGRFCDILPYARVRIRLHAVHFLI